MKNKKVLFIASVGGHLAQLLQLRPLFSDYDSYFITEKDPVTKKLPDTIRDAKVFLITAVRKSNIFLLTIRRIILVLDCLIKYFMIKPDVIISTGSVTGAVMCKIGKLFHSKIIYFETFASIKSPSRAAKIVYPIADVFYVQWESMLKFFPKAKFIGSLY